VVDKINNSFSDSFGVVYIFFLNKTSIKVISKKLPMLILIMHKNYTFTLPRINWSGGWENNLCDVIFYVKQRTGFVQVETFVGRINS